MMQAIYQPLKSHVASKLLVDMCSKQLVQQTIGVYNAAFMRTMTMGYKLCTGADIAWGKSADPCNRHHT